MSEDESVSDNERVLEIANESLLLGERIPKSKIMRKVLRSLPGKFDMKVTAIDEAHDITKLKLDELFGSLLTFEMAISHRENKKGKVVKKFKNLNTTGSNARNLTNYRRRDGKNNTRRFNEISNMRDSDYGRKKKGEGRIFRCRECEKVGHYRAKCPTFSRRQKKKFCANLSDEDTDDSEEDNSMNAFTACTTETNSGEVSKNAKLWKCKSMHLQQRKLLALQLKLLDEFVITVAREVILGHFAICYKETECINGSGCSKHMTGKRSFFSKLKECAQDMLLLEMV
ncbi:gag-pol polyprotein [Cucumis melo var. makuwa]|uniref:Gag-pol polyprotein n=1 Tax=Cucumis melo var. makuwa TaxID=1194695 RepID=A0A5D3DSI5_CUCMM|nr:gag-pol polyprotein [Cucumis melo var. makuwa]